MISIDVDQLEIKRLAHEQAFLAMLTNEQRASYAGLRKLQENKQTFVNEYDRKANELINFMYYLDQGQFAQLPDIEAGTVFSIITRLDLSGHENLLRHDMYLKQKPYKAKVDIKKAEWKHYKELFAKNIANGFPENTALKQVCDEIEKHNRAIGNPDGYICVKEGKDRIKKPRPSLKNVKRQLLPKVDKDIL